MQIDSIEFSEASQVADDSQIISQVVGDKQRARLQRGEAGVSVGIREADGARADEFHRTQTADHAGLRYQARAVERETGLRTVPKLRIREWRGRTLADR